MSRARDRAKRVKRMLWASRIYDAARAREFRQEFAAMIADRLNSLRTVDEPGPQISYTVISGQIDGSGL